MRRKDAHLANLGQDLVICAALQKETLEPIGWNLFDNMFRVEALASDLERLLVEVGCENLNLRSAFELGDVFGKQDGDRIGLFARRTTCDPYAHVAVGRFVSKNL